jgi:hypothetical protein
VDAAASGAWWCSQGGLWSVSQHSAQTTGANARRSLLAKTGGCVRQNRVVLAPVAGVKLAEERRPNRVRQSFNPSATVTRQIRRRGERGISRQTIARGMPECSDCTCMLVCVFRTFLHTRPRVQQAPGIPCALYFFGRMILEKLGRIAPRDCGVVFGGSHVIASEATCPP